MSAHVIMPCCGCLKARAKLPAIGVGPRGLVPDMTKLPAGWGGDPVLCPPCLARRNEWIEAFG
jgi:hypothetical protein